MASDKLDYIPIGEPDITESEINAVVGVLRGGWLTRGRECQVFEQEFALQVGAAHALYVNSCTAALHLALEIHGIRSGDEVILPSLTFAATGHSIVQHGAQPVFAEIDPSGYCLSAADVLHRITPKTRAIMAVHYAGYPADLAALRKICADHQLVLIEDAAHALGAAWQGIPIGGGDSTSCFSFYSNKNMTTAEGGMLTIPNRELMEHATRLSLHGMNLDAWNRFGAEGSWRYAVTEFGYKYNGNDLLAALGRAQLGRFNAMQAQRQRAWEWYTELLVDEERIICPSLPPDGVHACHLFVIRLQAPWNGQRDGLVSGLRHRGIGATVHFDPLHLHPAYVNRFGTQTGMLPVTEQIASALVSLPMHSKLTQGMVERVVRGVKEILDQLVLK
jgi:perosamine synthetase